MNPTSNVLSDVLLQTFLIFIGFGCVLSLLAGIWMLWKPDATPRLNRYFNRWFATDRFTTALVSPHTIESPMHRHHRLVGALVLLGSAYYIIFALLFALKTKYLANLLFQSWSEPVATWLTAALIFTLVAGNVLAAVVGASLLVRPNLLLRFEAWANRSYGTEKVRQALNVMHMQPDELVARHVRLVGVLIVAGSVYALASFWIAL
jgi:hypothetical protein